MMTSSKVTDLFKQGLLEIDCKELILSQDKVEGACFKGPGYIRQSADGSLGLKIYVSSVENTEPFGHFREQLERAPGKLLSSEDFYSLSAKSCDGLGWISSGIFAALSWDTSDGSAVATAQLYRIESREPASGSHHHLTLHFFEEYDVPLNLMTETEHLGQKMMVRDRAKFQTLNSEFEVRKHGGATVVEIVSEHEFPENIHLRVQEALQYITGKPAFWRARLEVNKIERCLELVTPLRGSARTSFNPPLVPATLEFQISGWKLFSCYLDYVVVSTKDTYWNPLAYHLHNACEASANSIDARAVGFSVAVEAVAGLVTLDHVVERAEHISRFQSRMRKYLETQTDFQDLRPRMEGLIGSLSSPRVEDTLYGLAQIGHVDRAYIKSWRDLRNRHVHPKLKDLKKPDITETQALITRIQRVEVLLRQLTFHLIGYEGPFTDYGVQGFPVKEYPLAIPNEQKRG